jgi:hypothetical protein
LRINLTSCISVKYDLPLLPYFIEHYRELDIHKFILIFNSSEEFSFEDINPLLLPIQDKVEIHKWVGDFNMRDKIDLLNEYAHGDYIITADVDELQAWGEPLKFYADKNLVVWGKLRDRENTQEVLSTISSGSLFEQFPRITNRSDWGPLSHKPCLFPSKFKLLSPHHLESNVPNYDNPIPIDHFRWIRGRLEKSYERLDTYERLNKEGIKPKYFYRSFPRRDLFKVIYTFDPESKRNLI